MKIGMQSLQNYIVVQKKNKSKLEAGAPMVRKALDICAIASDKNDDVNSSCDGGDADSAGRRGNSREKMRPTVNHSDQKTENVDRLSAAFKHSVERRGFWE